jgi:hypothetical protein
MIYRKEVTITNLHNKLVKEKLSLFEGSISYKRDYTHLIYQTRDLK